MSAGLKANPGGGQAIIRVDGVDRLVVTPTEVLLNGVRLIRRNEVYGGRVNDAGGATILPAGWSCLRISNPGVYEVIHNLGHFDYTVTLTPQNEFTRAAMIGGHLENSFTYRVRDGAGTLQNTIVAFALLVNP